MEKRNIYVEHNGEWYDYSHCWNQFPLDQLIEETTKPDAGNVRTDKREFEIGSLVKFECLEDWTEVVDCSGCETCSLNHDKSTCNTVICAAGDRNDNTGIVFKKYTPETTGKPEEPAAPIEDLKHDPVSHPAHYTGKNGVECIQVTEQFNFNRGNAIKYIWRAGEKDPSKEIEDLKKAVWYIEREIKRIEEAGE